MWNFRFRSYAALPVGVGLLFSLSGCGGGSSGGGPGSGAASLAEPTAGSWQPILVSAREAVTMPPLPGAEAQERELAQIKALQSTRTGADEELVRKWDAGASLNWNQIARDVVIRTNTPPPLASRLYAALSVAQYDSMVAVSLARYGFNRPIPAQTDSQIALLVKPSGDPSYPSDHAAVAAASAEILKFLYPAEAASFDTARGEATRSRLLAGVAYPSDIETGEGVGRAIAQRVIAYLQADGADGATANPPQPKPEGPGIWTGTDGLLPGWGKVKPWLTDSLALPPAPPAFGSAEFNADLAEVRRIADNRTAEQTRIAEFWADAANTFTPPGHWNLIAETVMSRYRMSEARQARVFALMNLAQMNAGICCWDAKYSWWIIRPTQADPAIVPAVGVPNFPSYTSGHSTFSGAASGVLASLFPSDATTLRALAQEASDSRVYGGIHFRFDSENGLGSGREIAKIAVERGNSDGSPAYTPQRVAGAPSLDLGALRAELRARGQRVRASLGTSAKRPIWD